IELNGRKVLTRLIEGSTEGDRPNVRVPLKLDERPGKGGKTPNEVVFVARNKGALPGYESQEQVKRFFALPHIPTPVPEVSVRAVTPSPDAEAPREGGVVVITEKTVRIRGTIRAAEDLTLAEVAGKSLVEPGKKPGKQLDFDVPYTAGRPDRQTVEVVAKAEGSGGRVFRFDIDDQPSLPGSRLLPPRDLLRAPAARRTIRLRGEFTPRAGKEHTIEVRHNGQRARHELDGDGRFLSVPLTLEPG